MLKQIIKCSCVCSAIVLVCSAIGALVDTDGNAATNQTLLGDIDMGVGTLGDLTAYVTNVVDQSRITDGTNTIDVERNVYNGYYIDAWVNLGSSGTYLNVYTNRIGTTEWYSIYPDFIEPKEPRGYVVYDDYGQVWQYNTENASPSLEVGGPDATSLSEGFFLRGNWPICVGKLALTNDIPSEVTVAAPSTNATAGTAADALATGTALYTGFTEWVVVIPTSGDVKIVNESEGWVPYYEGEPIGVVKGDALSTNLAWSGDPESMTPVVATRHLITPTKTSQLENDGPKDGLNVGHPFATTNQIPDITSLSNRIVELENQLSGIHVISTNKYDFSTNVGLYTGVRDIIVALGGTVTNFPAIQNGGN